MKFSVRGSLRKTDGSAVVDTINSYVLWRLITNQTTDEVGNDVFVFEAWVNTEADKTALFNDVKQFVDANGEQIDWHECTHDEANPQPCIIAETYIKG